MKETNGVFRGAQRMPSYLNRQFSWWSKQGRQHEKWGRTGSGMPRSRLTFYAAAGVSFTSASIAVIAVYDRKQISASRAEHGQLPLNYDPGAFAAFWDQHVCMQLARVGTITLRVVPFLLRSAWLYYHPVSSSRQISESEPHAAWGADWGAELRELLVDLGPTFIKFGQMLSIRPDLLPAPVLRELQRLCDAVPAFPTPEAIDLIERELGSGAVARLFEGLDNNTTPVAAASLGQVYCCRLREEGKKAGTGALVALKVQRPDMVISVSLDLLLLRRYMQIVEVIKKSMMEAGIIAKRKQFDIDLLDTFAAASFCELDYQHEAANQERFQYELEKRGLSSTVRVPRVHRLGTSRRVLTTEWIQGKQLAHSSPETIRKLVPAGVEVFLVQLLDMGFFHSDPHPGNLLVDTQNRLVLIDFGLCAEVQQLDTRGMTKAIVHLMKGDVSGTNTRHSKRI
jgi:aarF domain-containing kinase